jgi:hypothetical protein
MRGQQTRSDPDPDTGRDVTWVVDTGVHSRVGDGACQRQ